MEKERDLPKGHMTGQRKTQSPKGRAAQLVQLASHFPVAITLNPSSSLFSLREGISFVSRESGS